MHSLYDYGLVCTYKYIYVYIGSVLRGQANARLHKLSCGYSSTVEPFK